MLVKELIAKLQEQDQEAQIVICDRRGLVNDLISDNIITDEFENKKRVPIFVGPLRFEEVDENRNNN